LVRIHWYPFIHLSEEIGGGWGGFRAREKRGREVYSRREERGQEARFPMLRKVGEIGGKYTTLCKKKKRKEAK